MESLLERVQKKNMESLPEIIEKSDSFETDEKKPMRSSSSSSNSITLPNLCILYDKDVK